MLSNLNSSKEECTPKANLLPSFDREATKNHSNWHQFQKIKIHLVILRENIPNQSSIFNNTKNHN